MDEQKRDSLKALLAIAKGLISAMDASRRGEQDEFIFKHAGYRQFILRYDQLVRSIYDVDTAIGANLNAYDVNKLPGPGDTTTIQQKSLFDGVRADLAIAEAVLETRIGLKADQAEDLKNFLRAKLRKAIFATPEKEIEVQNAIEQLLIGRGMEKGIHYDREVGRVKVSIKEVIPDFVFYKLDMALEVKLSKTPAKSKEIVDEINADISAYSQKYSSLFFLIYDLGSIRDEDEFKQGLETTDAVSVAVVKH